MAYEDWTETLTCSGCLAEIPVSEFYISNGETLRSRNFCPRCNVLLNDDLEVVYEDVVEGHLG